jgi:hypothetical protein
VLRAARVVNTTTSQTTPLRLRAEYPFEKLDQRRKGMMWTLSRGSNQREIKR